MCDTRRLTQYLLREAGGRRTRMTVTSASIPTDGKVLDFPLDFSVLGFWAEIHAA